MAAASVGGGCLLPLLVADSCHLHCRPLAPTLDCRRSKHSHSTNVHVSPNPAFPCRAEIEAQEALIDQLEGRLAEAERRGSETAKRAAAAEATAVEREGMIAYVGEEVDRVKALFEQKVRWRLP